MWKPTDSKIVNFGYAWDDDMKIIETSDAVLGTDDPGGTPIALTALDEGSAKAFGYVMNNLKYVANIMVFEDVTINVSTVAQLQAALDVLGRVTYVHKDKTFNINIATGTYAWPAIGSETRPPIFAKGIHGAGIVMFTMNGTPVFQSDASTARPICQFYDCTCNLIISGACTFSNTDAAATRAVDFSKVRQVTALDLQVRNATSSDNITSAVYCREAEFVDLGLTVNVNVGIGNTNVGRAIYARVNSNIHVDTGNLTLGDLDTELFYLEKNSRLVFDRFDGVMPSGANMGNLSQAVTVDPTSRIMAHTMSSSGAGTSSSPYVITIAWESGTNTPRLINRLIEALPQPLDVFVKLKLPAGTMTAPITIVDKKGKGELELEGNTVLVAQGTTQDSIIDSATHAIEIRRNQLRIKLDSLKLDGDSGGGALVSGSRRVNIDFCYALAATVGSGFSCTGVDCQVQIKGCKVDVCAADGIYAAEGASVRCIDSSVVGPSNDPVGYGNHAEDSACIYRSNTGGKYFTGSTATDNENEGGKVFNS